MSRSRSSVGGFHSCKISLKFMNMRLRWYLIGFYAFYRNASSGISPRTTSFTSCLMTQKS